MPPPTGSANATRALQLKQLEIYQQILRGIENLPVEDREELLARSQGIDGTDTFDDDTIVETFTQMLGGELDAPPPNRGRCRCPDRYADLQVWDFGASEKDDELLNRLFARSQGSEYEELIRREPELRAMVEMRLGGRIVPDGGNDGIVRVQPFPQGYFPAGGQQNQQALNIFQMFAGFAATSSFQNASSALRGPGIVPFGGSGFGQTLLRGLGTLISGASNPFGFMYPYNYRHATTGPGGPYQEMFGYQRNSGWQVTSVLNDPSLTVEDKVVLFLMLIMQKADKDIERRTHEISKMQEQQDRKQEEQSRRQNGGWGGDWGGGGRWDGGITSDWGRGSANDPNGKSSPSIDLEVAKLNRMVTKRQQMFDMLRQIIDKYNQTAKGMIDSMGR